MIGLLAWATFAFAQIGPLPGMGPLLISSPIGTPGSLGTAGSISSSTTQTLTTTANINSGDLALVCVTSTSSTASYTLSSLSDGTNSYSKATSIYFNGTQKLRLDLWYAPNAAAVSSGATITATFSAAVSEIAMTAWHVSGLIASPLDKVNSAAGATLSTTATTSTGTLSYPNEIVAGCAGSLLSTTATYTVPSGFANINQIIENTNSFNGSDYDTVLGTGSVTYNPIWSVNGDPMAIVATFEGN